MLGTRVTGSTISPGSLKLASMYLLALAFSMALVDIFNQALTFPSGDFAAMDFAYFAFPFLVFATFFAVYAHSYTLVREAWSTRSVRIASWSIGVGYGLLYIFATSVIELNPDDLQDLPASLVRRGFVVPFSSYGPMTMWPNVEFYLPRLNLFSAPSVGNILLVASLSLLAAFSSALVIQSLRRRMRGRRSMSFYVGAFATALSANNCCCCAPVLLPALSLLFGGATTGTLTFD